MGVTYVNARVARSAGHKPSRIVRFMVDSGAVYTVLPERTWRELKLRSTRTADFVLADGTTVSRGVAEAHFDLAGVRATSPVVLGEGKDTALLGAVTLETLGLMLNPLSREVVPMRLVLARLRP